MEQPFDLDALVRAGFNSVLTESRRKEMAEDVSGPATAVSTGRTRHAGHDHSTVQTPEMLERDDVRVTMQQNTQERPGPGARMTVTYPTVAIIEGPKGSVSCAADQTDLILTLANQVTGVPL